MMIHRRGVLIGSGALALSTAAAGPAYARALNGKPAPDFRAIDSKGAQRSLAEFGGRICVLEWTNHDCPYVRKHYGAGAMQALQARATGAGAVWLSIISSAPGQQGFVSGAQADTLTAQRKAAPSAVLLDPTGAVGRLYGAKTTPHMFVINAQGALVYQGGIDDRATANPADLAKATNYVQAALDDLAAGRTVAVATSTPYGCSVKYAV